VESTQKAGPGVKNANIVVLTLEMMFLSIMQLSAPCSMALFQAEGLAMLMDPDLTWQGKSHSFLRGNTGYNV
jgi:hypothetical protein